MKIRFKFTLIFVTTLVLSGCNDQPSSEGDKLFDQRKFADAIEAYSSTLETNPRDVTSLYNRGRSFEELGQFDNAIADYESIIEMDPKNINAFLSLAKLSYNQGNFNKALVYTSSVIELNENSAQAQFLSGRSSHQLGYFDQALEAYNNAITINRDFGEAYLYRGALKIGQKKVFSACEDFKFAKSLGVDGADAPIKEYCE